MIEIVRCGLSGFVLLCLRLLDVVGFPAYLIDSGLAFSVQCLTGLSLLCLWLLDVDMGFPPI